MRAGGYHQRGIVFAYVIEMKPQSYHARQQPKWRFRVMDTLLDGPIAETFFLRASPQGHRAILMPGQGPVGIGRLVEENRPDRTSASAQFLSRDGPGPAVDEVGSERCEVGEAVPGAGVADSLKRPQEWRHTVVNRTRRAEIHRIEKPRRRASACSATGDGKAQRRPAAGPPDRSPRISSRRVSPSPQRIRDSARCRRRRTCRAGHRRSR